MTNVKLGQKVIEEIEAFIQSRKSLMLSTLTEDKLPSASYAPFVTYDQHLYIFISGLALHTQNLIDEPHASVLFIEDEDNCANVFARLRLSYQITSNVISRDEALWQPVIQAMTEKLGEQVTQLSQLGDFVLFQLTPTSGRFVKGFGKAYELEGDNLQVNSITHIRGN